MIAIVHLAAYAAEGLSHEDPARPPVVGRSWDPRTGRLSRVREADDLSLRTLVRLLAATGSGTALDGSIARVIAEVVAPHPVGDR